MSRTVDSYDKLCHTAAKLETFRERHLREHGFTSYTIAAAVQDGLLQVCGIERNGLRGRPARLLRLTAKGKRAAARHERMLEKLAGE